MPQTPTHCVTRDGVLKARVLTQSNRNGTGGTLAPRARRGVGESAQTSRFFVLDSSYNRRTASGGSAGGGITPWPSGASAFTSRGAGKLHPGLPVWSKLERRSPDGRRCSG